MPDEPINLREARANKAEDARLWTPLDALKALVRDLENGECQEVQVVYVAMGRINDKGQLCSTPFYTAGSNTLGLRGLLTQHLYDMCDSFANSRKQ